jgi:hypothetical protein
MAFFIHVLPDVTGDLGENRGFGLLPVSPSFFLPELEDKPQDPIISAFSRFEPISESPDVPPSQNILQLKRAELSSEGWSPQYSRPDIKESVWLSRSIIHAYSCVIGQGSLLGQNLHGHPAL